MDAGFAFVGFVVVVGPPVALPARTVDSGRENVGAVAASNPGLSWVPAIFHPKPLPQSP